MNQATCVYDPDSLDVTLAQWPNDTIELRFVRVK